MPATDSSVSLMGVPARFEAIARLHADRVALASGGDSILYRELDAWSAAVAAFLSGHGVGRGDRVGLFIDRSFDYIAACLGTLRAGACYVPIDPAYPRERLELIANDSQATAILHADAPPANAISGARTLRLPSRNALAPNAEPRRSAAESFSPDDPAYIMYTSGSTGQPKGVVIPHRGIERLVCGADFFEVTTDDVFLMLAPTSFDASTFEIWGALLNGARLEIMRPGLVSLAEIGTTIRRAGVTTLWLTAGLFNLMVDERVGDLAPVRQLLTGGDVLSAAHIRRALDALPATRLINGYGPTENTTFTCCHAISRNQPADRSVPIGRPIRGTTVHLVDGEFRAVENGTPGELVTGGLGLALGYWNRPELTAEKFVPDPFSDTHDGRLYRTGDQARRLADGTYEFLGRNDNQVKLRGYRIELGEIESVLRKSPRVRDCAVAVKPDAAGNRQLSAYVVPSGESSGLEAELRAFAADRLPDFMVPVTWTPLAELPLNPNGKVDRNRLPAPAVPQTGDIRPSGDEMEARIAAVWHEVLGRQVDPAARYFDFGANSLLVTQVHERLAKQHGLQFPVTDMFRFPSIRSLAAHLKAAGSDTAPSASDVSSGAMRRAALGRFKPRAR